LIGNRELLTGNRKESASCTEVFSKIKPDSYVVGKIHKSIKKNKEKLEVADFIDTNWV
jgi:hypothetical protein